MIIPNKIKVGGHVYRILHKYKFTQEPKLCGQADHDNGEIRLADLDPSGVKRGVSRIEETFIHEVLHCINNIYNDNKLVEEDISRMSQGLYQVLADNKMVR
jgi:hypothetical protein